jgi:aminopeptidase N
MRLQLILIMLLLSFSIYARQGGGVICSESRIANYTHLNKTGDITYPGDSSIDVEYYKLSINVFPELDEIHGVVTVGMRPDSDNLNEFYLDLEDNMDVSTVTKDGSELSFSHSDDKLTIQFNETYTPDDRIDVVITYSGDPNSSGFGSFNFDSQGGYDLIWTLSQPYGASDWWPCKDTPADKADSADIWITCDKELIPVSNGTLIEIVDVSSDRHMYKWSTKYPIAQYLISMAITKYELYTNYFKYSETDSLEMIHYNYIGELNSYRIGQLDKVVTGMEIFTELYGDYPFLEEKYGQAEFDFGGAMEHQTISSMGSYGTGITMHELGHQWFGDKITCRDWHHVWLNEGFATYSEAAYYEETQGFTTYQNVMGVEMSNAKDAIGSVYVEDISTVRSIFNNNRSYAKGATILHMLRGIVGKDTFYDILKRYANDINLGYDVAVTEDFQAIAEEVTGLDLNYFFQQWIYGENYPVYDVVWGYSPISENKYNVTVRVEQESNTSPKFFTMPVELQFTGITDTVLTIWNDAQIQQYNFVLDFEPAQMLFDPDEWILKDFSTALGADDKLTPLFYSLDQNYPNPFNPSTTIEFSIPESTHVLLKVYDSLGKEVKVLLDEGLKFGKHSVNFDAAEYASGVYIYKIETNNFQQSRKMILLR